MAVHSRKIDLKVWHTVQHHLESDNNKMHDISLWHNKVTQTYQNFVKLMCISPLQSIFFSVANFNFLIDIVLEKLFILIVLYYFIIYHTILHYAYCYTLLQCNVISTFINTYQTRAQTYLEIITVAFIILVDESNVTS